MHKVYPKMLQASIENEKKGIEYDYNHNDGLVLAEMTSEIKSTLGYNIRYLAEIDAYNLKGAGTIMAKYFDRFESEGVRAYILPQIIEDKVKESFDIARRGYISFKNSSYYISGIGETAPAYIYVRYDNSFKRLKPKKNKNQLMELITSPRDAFYLTFTVGMLASWKVENIEPLLLQYFHSDKISAEELGINDYDEYYPSVSYIRDSLRYIAIDGLRYYPSEANYALIKSLLKSDNKNVIAACKKSLRYMEKKLYI